MHVSSALRPGLAFMTMHFPDEVETNRLTIEATDPKSGTAEFKATAIRVEKLDAGERRRVVGGACELRSHLESAEPTDDERAAIDDFVSAAVPTTDHDLTERVEGRIAAAAAATRSRSVRSCCRRCTPAGARSDGSARAA